jgi:hypothetical protein
LLISGFTKLLEYANSHIEAIKSIKAVLSLIAFISLKLSKIFSLISKNISYSLSVFFHSASNISHSNSLSFGVINLEAFTKVCLKTKILGTFETWLFGISIKYPETEVYLIFNKFIQEILDNSD